MLTEAQIFLTRRCNLNCSYCKLTKRKLDELSLEDWLVGFKNLEKIGIKTVKILGGEPTVKTWFPELLDHLPEFNIKFALLSNSIFDKKILAKIKSSNLYGYFASVDSLNSGGKSSAGYKMLQELKNSNIEILAANVVITKENIFESFGTIEKLSKEGFFVNICTVQHTDNPYKEFSTNASEFKFEAKDRELLQTYSEMLYQMKKKNVKIAVSNDYIFGIPRYGIHGNWQCTAPLQLRIDADGGMMLCNEFRTSLAEKYNILDIDETYSDFLEEWQSVRSSIKCDGCYWSCFINAEANLKDKKQEFAYSVA